MDQSSRQRSWLVQGFSLFLIIGLLYLTVQLAKINISLSWIPTIAMLVLGIPCFIGGIVIYGRYKDVYDYEPASLFGRQSNGKNIRNFLLVFIYPGFWLSAAGAFLLILILTGIIEQLVK